MKEKALKQLYKTYNFIAQDISQFEEIVFSGVPKKNTYDEMMNLGKENTLKFIVAEINNNNLVDIFKKSVENLGLDKTFTLFDGIIEAYDLEVTDDDIMTLSSIDEYQKFYQDIISNNKEKIDDDDYSFIKENLLRQIIEEIVTLSEDVEIEEIKEKDYDKLTDDILRDYLIEISKFKVLTKEEEQELFKRYTNGDDDAKETIINHNLKLVVSIAKKRKPYNLKMSMMDYIQEGNIGLIKAVDKFDISRGNKFSTYATWWINNSLDRAVMDNDSTIRVPVHMHEKTKKINKFINNYIREHNEPPSDETIIQELKISEEQLKKYYDIISILNPESLDKTIDNDGKKDRESSFGSFIADTTIESPEDTGMRSLLREREEKIMHKILTPKEEGVIRMRIGFDDDIKMTLEEIGKTFGITRERVRQIEVKAIRKMQQYEGAEDKRILTAQKKVKNKGYDKRRKKYIDKIDVLSNGRIKVKKYIDTYTLVDVKCLLCGFEWQERASSLSRRCTCPKCNSEIKVERKKYTMKERRKVKQIYELVKSDKEVVEKIIENLSEEEKKLIEKRKISALSHDENVEFFNMISRIKTQIKTPNYTKPRKVEKIVLPKKEIEKLEERPSLETIKEKVVEVERKDKTIADKELFYNKYKELLYKASKDIRVLELVDLRDLLITCVRYGIGDNIKPKSPQMIAKFYDISIEEVEKISETTLAILHNSILNTIDEKQDDTRKKLIKKDEKYS